MYRGGVGYTEKGKWLVRALYNVKLILWNNIEYTRIEIQPFYPNNQRLTTRPINVNGNRYLVIIRVNIIT